jgi:hypothetical protein
LYFAHLSIRQQLNKKFYNWKFVLIDKEIHQHFKTRVSRQIRPDLIKGDFDSNGQIDYAVYIVHGKRRTRKTSAIAFLKIGSIWEKYILESGSAGDETTPAINYLSLEKKNSWYYDYHKDKKYKFPHDAIFFGYLESFGELLRVTKLRG